MTITTAVPQATFSALGFIPAPDSALLAGTFADINQAFGGGCNPALSTPQGQLSSSNAAIVANTQATFCNLTQQMDPAYNYGRYQDGIARIYYLTRLPALPTTLQILCTGGFNVIIAAGALIQDSSGNQYANLNAGTIPIGGSLTLSFAALVPGPIPVPNVDEVSIYQSIPGWDSIACTSGTIGQNTESAAAFRARRAASVESNSQGPIGAMIGAVAQVPGVIDYYGYSNNTAGPVTVLGVTIPANALYIAVAGGAESDVAQAIFSKLIPGPPMFGNTTVTVYDTNPLLVAPQPYQITYETCGGLDVLFEVNIVNGPNVPSNAVTLVQNAIIGAFAGTDGGARARIASLLLATRYYAPIAALGPWAQVRTLGIGSTNTPAAVFDAMIVAGAMTTSNLTSGAIAIGQTISDGDQYVLQGTTIISGSGTSWVLNNAALTVAGASFTGSGSGTTLTASAVTGTIQVGNTIVGTGVPTGTAIIGQLTGTPGGAGTYQTSNATTSSSASLNAVQAIKAAVPSLNSVQVQANQAPSVSAANIAVTVT